MKKSDKEKIDVRGLQTDLPNQELPEWLEDVLRPSAPVIFRCDVEARDADEVFANRCQAAIEIALSVAKLKKERQRIGFVPLPLTDYVDGLAKVSGISLAPLLAWLNLKDHASVIESQAITGLARLAQVVGISLRETLAHIRLGLAAQSGSAPIPLLVARRRSTGSLRTPLEECEIALKQIEAKYPLSLLHELQRVELEVGKAYAGRTV